MKLSISLSATRVGPVDGIKLSGAKKLPKSSSTDSVYVQVVAQTTKVTKEFLDKVTALFGDMLPDSPVSVVYGRGPSVILRFEIFKESLKIDL